MAIQVVVPMPGLSSLAVGSALAVIWIVRFVRGKSFGSHDRRGQGTSMTPMERCWAVIILWGHGKPTVELFDKERLADKRQSELAEQIWPRVVGQVFVKRLW